MKGGAAADYIQTYIDRQIRAFMENGGSIVRIEMTVGAQDMLRRRYFPLAPDPQPGGGIIRYRGYPVETSPLDVPAVVHAGTVRRNIMDHPIDRAVTQAETLVKEAKSVLDTLKKRAVDGADTIDSEVVDGIHASMDRLRKTANALTQHVRSGVKPPPLTNDDPTNPLVRQ